MMAVMVGASGYILTSGFSAIESDRIRLNSERVQQAFEVEIENLNTKLSDWSSWDDVYEYIVDHNPEFEKSNLTDSTMENLNVQLITFIDAKGSVVKAKAHNLGAKGNSTVPPEISSKFTDPKGLFSALASGESVKGFIMTKKGPIMIVSRPIYNSNGQGPARGVIVFARYYGEDEIARLDNITRLTLELYTLEKLIQNHGQSTLDKLMAGAQFEGISMGPQVVEGYILLKDIYGKPAFPVEIKMDRDIYVQSQKTIQSTGFIAIIASIIFLIVTLYGFSYFVIFPLDSLSSEILRISKSGDMSLRLPMLRSEDEIGKLSKSINNMLQSIEYSSHLLSEERKRSKVYIDVVGVMIVALGPTGDVTLINKRACEILGTTESNVLGKNWFDTCIPEGERETARQKFMGTINGATSDTYIGNIQSNIRTFDGNDLLIAWNNTVVKNSSDQIIAVILSGEDITRSHFIEQEREKRSRELEETKVAMFNILEDSKDLEEKIKFERDRANMIISSMSEGLFVVDTDKIVILVNPAAHRMMGMQESEMLGRKLTDFTTYYNGETIVPSEERPLIRTLEKGESMSFGLDDNQYIEGKNGKVPVAISTMPLKQNGVIIGALVSFHDISKDKLIKETIEDEVEIRTRELHDERAKLIASINSLNMGYLLMDTGGQPLIANSLLSKILGSSNTVVTIRDIDNMFGATLNIGEQFKSCIADKHTFRQSDVNYGGKILKVWLIPVVVVENAQDKVIGAVLLVEDVTERKVMERSKDEFFSIASHELRTPLTAIRGNTSMIMDFYMDKIPDPDMKEMITDIHASSIRLIDIVNDFLNVSRLEQGKIDFNTTEFDLVDLVKESVTEFEGSALEKHVVVRFEGQEGVAMNVKADRDRTKQVILNLISNGLKFTESGEVVSTIVRDGDMVRYRVKDSGRGIPQDNQPLLFHKFQQAGSSLFTRDTTKGTGLGLYISKLIIEGMKGKIWLEKSEEGVGSEFCFTLPIVT